MRLPKLRIPWRDRAKPPRTGIQGRTGDLRYSWTEVSPEGKRPKAVLAHRIDTITIEDLDRVRFYPTVRDALRTRRGPLERADFFFTCPRKDVAEAAQALLERPIRNLLRTLFKGAGEFGRQSCEIVWEPEFDVVVTEGQGDGQTVQRYYPFLWAPWFKSFSPKDTRVLVHRTTGRFAGVRQFVRPMGELKGEESRDVLAPKAIHYVNDPEFDGNYGTASSKAAIPFVDAAVSLLDSMVQFGDILANPYKKVRYPTGMTVNPDGGQVDNGDRALEIGEAFEGGSTVCIPSEPHAIGGQPTSLAKWDVEFEQPASATADYVGQLAFLNGMIRLSVCVPEMASGGDAPETGTYNLGEVQIQLFMHNLQAELDAAEDVINEQLLKYWTAVNFGASCPPVRIRFKPLDLRAVLMLLQALLQNVSTGEPLVDADGNLLYVDWNKLAGDNGVPLVMKKANRAAQDLAAHVAKKLQEVGSPDSGKEANGAIDPSAGAELSEWSEGDHPRDASGRFVHGSGHVDAEGRLDYAAVVGGRDAKSLKEDALSHARSLIGSEVVNAATGNPIKITEMAISKKEHGPSPKLPLLLAIETILERMTFLRTEPDRKGRPNVAGFHYYTMPVVAGGREQSIVVQVREDNNGHLYYDWGIEKTNAQLGPGPGREGSDNSGMPAGLDHIIARLSEGHELPSADLRPENS